MSPKKVLIVDLDAGYRGKLAYRLSVLGLRSYGCDSPKNLDEALKDDWDLIITDWDFYQFSGLPLLQTLRAKERPVLVCSDRDTFEIAEEGLKAGAKGVFSRQRQGDLVEEVEALLELKQGLGG